MPAMSTKSRESKRDYQRAYKACFQCRKQKTRCLTDGYGPCTRCARQRTECIPSDTHASPRPRGRGVDRDKSTACRSLVSPDLFDSLALTLTDTASLGRRTMPAEPEKDPPSDSTASLRSHDYAQTPAVDEFTVAGQYQTFPSQTSQNPLARSVVQTVISGPNDALNLLFDVGSSRAPVGLAANTDTVPTHSSHLNTRQDSVVNLQEQAKSNRQIEGPSQHAPKVQGSLVRVWQSCHFVRMGWLTAREALQYIDL